MHIAGKTRGGAEFTFVLTGVTISGPAGFEEKHTSVRLEWDAGTHGRRDARIERILTDLEVESAATRQRAKK